MVAACCGCFYVLFCLWSYCCFVGPIWYFEQLLGKRELVILLSFDVFGHLKAVLYVCGSSRTSSILLHCTAVIFHL